MLGVSEKQSILDAIEHLLARSLEVRSWCVFGGGEREKQAAHRRGGRVDAGSGVQGRRGREMERGKEVEVGRSGAGRRGEVEREGEGRKEQNGGELEAGLGRAATRFGAQAQCRTR